MQLQSKSRRHDDPRAGLTRVGHWVFAQVYILWMRLKISDRCRYHIKQYHHRSKIFNLEGGFSYPNLNMIFYFLTLVNIWLHLAIEFQIFHFLHYPIIVFKIIYAIRFMRKIVAVMSCPKIAVFKLSSIAQLWSLEFGKWLYGNLM